MNHILAAGAVSLPHHLPPWADQDISWIIRSVKLIAVVLFVVVMIWRRVARWWAIPILLILGAVVIPSTSPKVNQYTTDVTHGSAVGQTGASVGMLVLLGAMIVAFAVMHKRDMGGGGGEE